MTTVIPGPRAAGPATLRAVDAELARQAAVDGVVPVPKVPPIADVIAHARATGDPRLVAQADKTHAAVTALVAMLAGRQELARAEQHVADLAAQLARAKAALRALKHGGGTKTAAAAADTSPAAAADRPDPRDVRAWAARTGVPCNAMGRVPTDIADAYLQAHRTT